MANNAAMAPARPALSSRLMQMKFMQRGAARKAVADDAVLKVRR